MCIFIWFVSRERNRKIGGWMVINANPRSESPHGSLIMTEAPGHYCSYYYETWDLGHVKPRIHYFMDLLIKETRFLFIDASTGFKRPNFIPPSSSSSSTSTSSSSHHLLSLKNNKKQGPNWSSSPFSVLGLSWQWKGREGKEIYSSSRQLISHHII